MSKALEYLMASPWAIRPELMEIGRDIVLRERAPDPKAVRTRDGRAVDGAAGVTIRDGVAVIPIVGPIFRYADFFVEMCGGATVEAMAKDLRTALESPSVRAVLLDVDSPGGEANGISELAAMIRAGTAVKPIVAYVGGDGCSAAYWLASASCEVVIDRTAMVGSIGVVMGYPRKRDDPRSVEFVSSVSPDKRPDVDTDGGRVVIQRVVDDMAAVFVASVAEHRGVSVETVLADFGRGGVLVGEKAVAAGMADRLGSFESVLAELAVGASPKPKPSTKPREGTPTPRPNGPLSAKPPLIKGAGMSKPNWLQRMLGAGVASAVEAGEPIDFDAVARMERAAMDGGPAHGSSAAEPSKIGKIDVTQSDEYKALAARLANAEAAAAATVETEAAAFVGSLIRSERLLPAQAADAKGLLVRLAADDRASPLASGSRLDAAKRLMEANPKHGLTTDATPGDDGAPNLPPGAKVLPSAEGKDPKRPLSPAELDRLLAMTDQGRAVLAVRKS